MAPLDTGSVTNVVRLADAIGRGPGPSASQFATVGEFLRATREHRNLSLMQVADATRVRRLYLEAIERGDLAPLPSRPFAVGYVRAYAKALGLDGDAAVARFKAEHPEEAPTLRAPLGVGFDKDPRRQVIYAAVAVLVVAVALWNIAQHNLISSAKSDAILPATAPVWPATARTGPVTLSAPTAPPADQTTPKPYVTPGLGVPGVDKNAPTDAAATDAAPAPPPEPAPPAVFTSRAAIYGVPAKEGPVLIQAKSAASLIVRGPAGQIFFARELEPGEAYRAPLGRGLTADVSDPNAFLVYTGGKLVGALSDPQTSIDKAAQPQAQAQPAAH